MEFSHKRPTPIVGTQLKGDEEKLSQCMSYFVIVIAETGRMKAQMPGGEALIQAGDIVFFGPEAEVRLQDKHDVSMSLVTVDPGYFIGTLYWLCPDSFRDRVEVYDFFSEEFRTKVHHIRVVPDLRQRLQDIVSQICALSSIEASMQVNCHKQLWWTSLMDVLFPVLLEAPLASWLHNQVGESRGLSDSATTGINSAALKTKRLLEGEIDKDWSLELLAQEVHMSSRHIVRNFKEAFGITPTEYLTSLRAHAMAELLRETDNTVEKVAQSVGWGSRARASSAFTKHFGITPGAYRSQARKGLIVI